MHSQARTAFTPRLVLGICVLLLGVLFLLDNFGYFDVDDVWRYWPVILIAVGLARLLQSRGGRGGGLFITGLGVLFLAHNLHLFRFDMWDLWLVLLVLLGLSMVWGAISGRHAWHAGAGRGGAPQGVGGGSGLLGGGAPSAGGSGGAGATAFTPASGLSMDAGSWVKAAAILGSSTRGSNSNDFRGGEATAVLGGCELDLRQATIAGTEAVLDVFAFWGGIEIRVPESWTVVLHATPLLGGVEDKTRRPAAPGKQLVVKGMVVMGGVEIKN
jgi:predicted membrane protein